MGLLTWLKGNTSSQPQPDPLAGEGGYTTPRGPMGQTGYPGSTGQVRTDPAAAGGKLRDEHQRATGYGVEADARRGAAFAAPDRAPAPNPPDRTRRGTGRAWVPPELQQLELQQDQTEWFGGPNRHVGTSELGPGHGLGSAKDTERQQTLGFEGTRGLGAGVPGDQPGRPHARQFFKGAQARPDGDNRFVFGGPNGGQQSYTFDAKMPYTGHGGDVPQNVGARFSTRGAILSGDRLYYSVEEQYFGDQGGQYGYARQTPDGPHRPTEYYEPGPWTANFYDTTAAAGSPAEAGTAKQAIDAVHYSPTVGGRRRG
jgi:hypothetical protein